MERGGGVCSVFNCDWDLACDWVCNLDRSSFKKIHPSSQRCHYSYTIFFKSDVVDIVDIVDIVDGGNGVDY